jgi:hypothetical protein
MAKLLVGREMWTSLSVESKEIYEEKYEIIFSPISAGV